MQTNQVPEQADTIVDPDEASRTRILVVDDEACVVNSLSRLLRNCYAGYDVETAHSAEEAMAVVQKSSVDVIVTDFRLPEMDGLELARNVQHYSPHTRSILMTAYGNDSMIQRAHKHGCVAYLEKPLDIDLLMQFIEQAAEPAGKLRLEIPDITLPEVVQFYAMKRGDVVLNIAAGSTRGLIAIKEGIVVHAKLGEKIGAQALLDMLECHNASATAMNCPLPDIKTLEVTWFSLSAAAEIDSPAKRLRLLNTPYTTKADLQKKVSSDDFSIAELIADFKHNRGGVRLPSQLEQSKPRTRPGRVAISTQKPKLTQRSTEPAVDDTLRLAPISTTAEDRRFEKVRTLINNGVHCFRLHQLERAKKCWTEALELDPKSSQAKENLKVLEKLLAYRENA